MSWELHIRRGPHEGERIPLSARPVVLGRDPGPDGHMLDGDPTVSRRHVEITADEHGVLLKNLSANGTEVNGDVVEASMRLAAGDVITLGSLHLVEVASRKAARARAASAGEPMVRRAGEAPATAAVPDRPKKPAPKPAPRPAASKRTPERATPAASPDEDESPGLLQRPVVLVGLIAYVALMLVGWTWLDSQGGDGPSVSWSSYRSAYLQRYDAEGLSPEIKAQRIGEADALVTEARIALVRGDSARARDALEALMGLDRDPDSPIYRYAAQRLGRVKGR